MLPTQTPPAGTPGTPTPSCPSVLVPGWVRYYDSPDVFPTSVLYALFVKIGVLTEFAFFEFEDGSQTKVPERYITFLSAEAFRAWVQSAVRKARGNGPTHRIRIDIGPTYTTSLRDRAKGDRPVAFRRQLVFDIDATDQDRDGFRLRDCPCTGHKTVCAKCWPVVAFSALAVKYVLHALFALEKVAVVFSGSRGLHVWCFDERAMRMLDAERTDLVHQIAARCKESPGFHDAVTKHVLPWWTNPTALGDEAALLMFELDSGVTEKRNHLLKSPMTLHPKTDLPCVPMIMLHPDRIATPEQVALLCDYDSLLRDAVPRVDDENLPQRMAPYIAYMSNLSLREASPSKLS